MVKKFTKKELQRLGCNEEEIDIAMSYQKLLPMPEEDFEMNARTLHEYLGVGREISAWISNRIKKYEFKEGLDFKISYETPIPKSGGAENTLVDGSSAENQEVDFASLSLNERKALNIRTEYYLTLNMCKELCTIENNELGRLARRYFILMEKIVIDNKDWNGVRTPERKGYKEMCNALSESIQRRSQREGDKFDYIREANFLNVICCGAQAQRIRNYFDLCSNELTRDSLEKDYNEKLAFLQKQNMIYIGMDMPTLDRVKLLIASFDVIYPNAESFLPSVTRADMVKAREELIEDLSK